MNWVKQRNAWFDVMGGGPREDPVDALFCRATITHRVCPFQALFSSAFRAWLPPKTQRTSELRARSDWRVSIPQPLAHIR